MSEKMIWFCKIGPADSAELPWGADAPMREAVQEAFRSLNGDYAKACFSGWGAQFTEEELAVIENREPRRELTEIGQLIALREENDRLRAALQRVEECVDHIATDVGQRWVRLLPDHVRELRAALRGGDADE